MTVALLEWFGCISGLLGSALLAAGRRLIWWGFVAFMLSNLAWIVFALAMHAPGLFTLQMGFVVTSAVGLIRHW